MPVHEIRWDWLAEVDRKIQRRQQILDEAREMCSVGMWFQVLLQGEWSRPFRVTYHKPRLMLFAAKPDLHEPPIRHRRLPWSTVARHLDRLEIRFLNPDGTPLE